MGEDGFKVLATPKCSTRHWNGFFAMVLSVSVRLGFDSFMAPVSTSGLANPNCNQTRLTF